MRPLLLTLALLAAGLPLHAQETELERKLSDKIAETLKKSGAPSASIAVVQDGKLAFVKAFGATAEARYAVGSISKQFTAAAILLLEEQRRLSLDDKVAKYSMGMRQRLGVAACLLGDPQLLILDEPMNGLDPAGMLDMRDMILSLVAEGRTVVLSSHLLDEVERTCDAVAIVDHGKVIRQGPISQLLAGSSFEVQVECSDPDRARSLLEGTALGTHVSVGPEGLAISLPEGTERDAIAAINRQLVEGGISVYRLQHIQASLESWFLEVTSRLGAPE